MKRNADKFILLLNIFSVLMIFFMTAGCSEQLPAYPDPEIEVSSEFSSNLPLMIVDTNGRDIPDEPKIPGQMKIVDNNEDDVLHGPKNIISGPSHEYIYNEDKSYKGNVLIEIRGNSSQEFAKKSYSLDTVNNGGDDDADIELLGFPEEHKWILYGPFSDKTLMRNHLAYKLSDKMMEYSPGSRFLELIFKEDDRYFYRGVYLLTEKIKRDSNRVDIEKFSGEDDDDDGDNDDDEEPNISGGYLLLVDRPDPGDYSFTTPIIKTPFIVVEPHSDRITAAQRSWIRDHIIKIESVLFGNDFRDEANGYAKYIDVESFIDYMLIREFFMDADTYGYSSYMFKNRDGEKNDRLTMGPVWDFNISLGNCNESHSHGGEPTGWDFNKYQNDPERGNRLYAWFRRLVQDDNFAERSCWRWNELRGGILSMENILSLIDKNAVFLDEAQERNFEKWPILGFYVWPNPAPFPHSYEGEISNMKTWIFERIAWMDDNIDNL